VKGVTPLLPKSSLSLATRSAILGFEITDLSMPKSGEARVSQEQSAQPD